MFWNKIRVISAEHCKCAECHWTVYIKMVNFMLCEHKRPGWVHVTVVRRELSSLCLPQGRTFCFYPLSNGNRSLAISCGKKGFLTLLESSGWLPGPWGWERQRFVPSAQHSVLRRKGTGEVGSILCLSPSSCGSPPTGWPHTGGGGSFVSSALHPGFFVGKELARECNFPWVWSFQLFHLEL